MMALPYVTTKPNVVDWDASTVLAHSSTTSTETDWSDCAKVEGLIRTSAIFQPLSSEVRILTSKDIKPAARALAEAFEHDELSKYFTHTPDRNNFKASQQWKLHLDIMTHVVRAHMRTGLATAIGPDYDCVALWLPPGTSTETFMTLLRGDMQRWRLGPKLSSEGRKRFFTEFIPKLHDTKLDVLGQHDKKSWYLVYIGTKPESRRQGLARKLIDHTLKQVDESGLYCYLESSNVANLSLYNSLGFQHDRYIQFDRAADPVELDIMVRKPKVQPRIEADCNKG